MEGGKDTFCNRGEETERNLREVLERLTYSSFSLLKMLLGLKGMRTRPTFGIWRGLELS